MLYTKPYATWKQLLTLTVFFLNSNEFVLTFNNDILHDRRKDPNVKNQAMIAY